MDPERRNDMTAAAVSGVLGVSLWLALVPHSDTSHSGARVSAFWWIMIVIAGGLGAAFGRRCAVIVAFALTVPQAVLAIWTAPRGDEGPIWVLVTPMLLVFGAFLVIPAWVAGWLRERLDGLRL